MDVKSEDSLSWLQMYLLFPSKIHLIVFLQPSLVTLGHQTKYPLGHGYSTKDSLEEFSATDSLDSLASWTKLISDLTKMFLYLAYLGLLCLWVAQFRIFSSDQVYFSTKNYRTFFSGL